MTSNEAEANLQLERLFLRLASINDDSKLEQFACSSLMQIIETMSSGSETLRSKGIELLSHFNRRIKSNSTIALPFDQLVTYLSLDLATRNIIATNLTMVYLRMAVHRLKKDEQLKVLPSLLNALKGNLSDKNVVDQIILLTAGGWLRLAEMNAEKWPDLSELNDPSIRSAVLKFFSDILAFPYPVGDLATFVTRVEATRMVNLSCISISTYLKIAKDLFVATSLSITDVKVAVLKVLSSRYFTDKDCLPLLPLGLANGCNEVEFAADSCMKRIDQSETLKDRGVINKLFTLYLGNPSKDLPQDDRIPCASVTLKLRIVPLLLRSEIASSMFPFNIKVAFDGLFGGDEAYPKPQKLQQLSAEFLLQVIKKFAPNSMATFGPIIFSSLRKLIDNCEYTNVVSTAYQCFGLIGQNVPKLIIKDMALVQETFNAIPKAPDDIAAAIIDCLISWLPIFCTLNDAANIGVLQTLISSYIQHESPKCRLVALKYVEALVKSPAVEFRWMLCQACGDARDEIRREARRLLELSISDRKFMPDFEDMAEYLHKKLKLDMETTTELAERDASEMAKKKKELFHDDVYIISAEYIFACARVASGHSAVLRSETDDSSAQLFPDISAFLKSIIAKRPEAIDAIMDIVLQAIQTNPLIHLFDIAILLLYCNGASVKETSRGRVLEVLKQYLSSSARLSICSMVAHMFVILLSERERSDTLKEYMNTLQNNSNILPSTIWVCAYMTCVDGSGTNDIDYVNRIQQQLMRVVEDHLAQPNTLLEFSCAALCESLRRSSVVIGFSNLTKLYAVRSTECIIKFAEQMGKLAASRKDTITLKMKEAAAGCLGFLSCLDLSEEVYEKIINELYAIGEAAPQPELQFSVGNALLDAVFGEYSPSRRNIFIESETNFVEANGKQKYDLIEKRMHELLNTIINVKLLSTNRHLRQSAIIWLVTVTKRSATVNLSTLSEELNKIQFAFINALAESNEFTQDVASKGLGIVFELADETQKKVMMNELVSALSSGRKRVIPVTGDTPIFEGGELGKAPGGENLTTYQELCSLATDLNQPELMYKFMQLANHNAMWNSKKGAAFGFSVVLQQARDEFEPYLSQIVPKLFRYRYDPDLKVQHSMKSIWQTLTMSKKNVVEEYADEIFSELLTTLTNALWRTRESSCLALSDLMSMKCTTNMEERFGDLFEILFRVQDDVKESVRLSANRALSTLMKLSIRECSSDRGAKATKLIGIILPTLIEKGLHSVVKANRMFSLKAVMDISKEAGSALQPHLITVVPCLLDALSETEPAMLNYLAARSDYDELEALDTARAGMANTSPMMQTLQDVVPFITKQTLTDLIPKLCNTLRSSVGLTTRTGACQFVINVCLRKQQIMIESKAACDKLMKALFSGLRDRNATVRKQFSSAISYLIKYCSDSQIESLIKFLKDKLDGDQEDDRLTALHILRALSTNNNEFLSGCASSLIPYVFMATCQQVEKGDEAAKKNLEMWEELWSEMITETNSTIRLYQKEMIDLAVRTLKENPIWIMKSQSATMLSRIIEAINEDIGPSDADEIYSILTSMLSGRLWDGKVKVVNAVNVLLKSNGDKLSDEWNRQSSVQEKFAPLWKECKKKDKVYKAEAIVCAGWFCEKTGSTLNGVEVFELIKRIFANDDQSSSDSDGASTDKLNNAAKTTARNTYLERVITALPHVMLTFHDEKMIEAQKFICSTLESSTVYWKLKQSLINELIYLFDRWNYSELLDMSEQFRIITELLIENTTQRRTFAQNCSIVLETMIKGALANKWVLNRDDPDGLNHKLKDNQLIQSSITFVPLLKQFFN